MVGGGESGLWNIEKAGAGWSRRAVLLGGLAAACSPEGDLAEGEQGRVARVMDGDALALDTGLKVRLAEIEAPAPGYMGGARTSRSRWRRGSC